MRSWGSIANGRKSSAGARTGRGRLTRFVVGAAATAMLMVSTGLQPIIASAVAPTVVSESHRGGRHWVAGWQGSPVPGATFDTTTCPSDVGLTNQTVRNIVPISAGGDRVRVRLSNTYGPAPLRIGGASVAVQAGNGAATESRTLRRLRFAGGTSALIPVGGTLVSDPVTLRVSALERLAVSIYLPSATGPATQHYFATQDNYLASGDQTQTGAGAAYGTKIICWLFATGVDVRATKRVVGTVVTLGDSITDGYGSTQNANRRYPDYLARRLAARQGRTLSVSNAGIGGNTLLRPIADFPVFGDPAPARIDRDVLNQPGVTDVILLEGINDIGQNRENAADLIQAQRSIIAAAHARGVKIYGATLTPFGGSNSTSGGNYGNAEGEQQRTALNHWIRVSGEFDGVFDFDKAVRDPADPTRMLAAFDSGDHLHPNDAGYRKMAGTIRITELVRR